MDEVTFIITLLQDRWSSAITALRSAGAISSAHMETPRFIDVRSIASNEGRRVDIDSQSVIVVFEDSNSTDYPTIDYSVRNETYTFTLHLRVLHRRDFAELTTSRERLQQLYKTARYIIETNGLRPTVYVGGGTSGTVAESAELIKLTGRSEANDRGKRLLGYKLSIELKRFARSI